MDRLVIASAASFETDELIQSLENRSVSVTRIITGIGLVASAMIAAQLRDLVEGRHVIFCGTGGVIGAFKDVSLHMAKSIELAPYDVRLGSAEILANFDPKIELRRLPFKFSDCRGVSSLGISIGPESAPEGPLTIETIELYAIARAWATRAKTLTAIIGTTNATGPSGRSDWKEHHLKAASITAIQVVAELDRLSLI
jgi:nucleoside phosphorylase